MSGRMLTVSYTPVFVRQFQKLETCLQDEVLEKIEQFKRPDYHKALKVHKLKGEHKNRYSFSVNYSWRIVFCYQGDNEAVLLTVGTHDIYK